METLESRLLLSNVTVTIPDSGGIDDSFALPADPASHNAVLKQHRQDQGVTNFKRFDERPVDHDFLHTFWGLKSHAPAGLDGPRPIVGAELTVRVRAGGDNVTPNTAISNDSLVLGFWESGTGYNEGIAWWDHLSDITGLSWENGTNATFTLDLANLPNPGNAPTSLVDQLNNRGFLDTLIQDDTMVDFMRLHVTYDTTPPTAEHNGPREVPANDSVTLDATSSTDSDSGIRSVLWNIDDGQGYAHTGTVTFNPADVAGPDWTSHAVALQVEDWAGNVTTTTTTIYNNLVVNSTSDNVDPNDGEVTLREAILTANNQPGSDIIQFNIPQEDPGLDDIDGDGIGDVYVIQPASALPALTDDGTTIDARTQTIFGGDTNPAGPEIVIDGSLLEASSDGLTLLSDHNQVFHLTIQHAPAYGIRVDQGSGNWIAGNFMGTDATGTVPAVNGHGGIGITRGHDNVIGTNGDGQDDVAERNLISGNLGTGVEIRWNSANNRIAGNWIGTDHTGSTALGNGVHGVHITSPNNLVGTDGSEDLHNAAEGNVISANAINGVMLEGNGATGYVVAGNVIGLDANGTAALGNGLDGIRLWNAPHAARIGTDGNGVADTDEANVIAANGRFGIWSVGGGDHVIAGSFIGVTQTGQPRGNANHGVLLQNSANNRIGTDADGTADAAERNIISANGRNGISINGAGSTDNVVAGNFVGTDPGGTQHLGNGIHGVEVANAATNNRIGLNALGIVSEATRNIISANGVHGVAIIHSGTSGNHIAGNYIGTDVSGSQPLGNGTLSWHAGVILQSGASQNIVGTDGDGVGDDAEGNLISGNVGIGVRVAFHSNDNQIAGNLVGTDADGLQAVGNAVGVTIQSDSTGNLLSNNVISGQTQHGVGIWNAAANEVTGNLIGTDFTGEAALPNAQHGMQIGGGAQDNHIHQNVISGNTTHGVVLRDAATQRNLLSGNRIGTTNDGSTALGNGGRGIWVFLDASDNQIGGDPAQANTIAFNGGDGVIVSGSQTIGNSIRANSIHSNTGLGINLGGDGVTPNDTGDTDTGPNDLQNLPVLSRVTRAGTRTVVVGTFDSTPNATFALDFYANTEPNPSGHGEGQRWMGTTSVTTDADGHAAIAVILDDETVPTEFIAATATSAGGSTSEFSLAAKANTPPMAVPDHYTVPEDGVLTVSATDGVLANDTDPDGDPLHVPGMVSGPAHGTVTVHNDGSFTYTPAPDFHGTDEFQYEIRDGYGGTAEATVTIEVLSARDQLVLLQDQVAALQHDAGLNRGLTRSLIAKLDAALNSLDREQPHVAANQLRAFIEHLDALQRAGRIDVEQAVPLVEAAEAAMLSMTATEAEGDALILQNRPRRDHHQTLQELSHDNPLHRLFGDHDFLDELFAPGV